MNNHDIRRTLQNVIDTGKLGTPVSIRVHLQLPGPDGNPTALLDQILEMLQPCLDEFPAELHSRRHRNHSQTNVLLRTPTGKTVFVTIGFGSAEEAMLHLLVVGNHGMAQLERTEDFPTDAFAAVPPG
ncbi:MAG: hypothetical protein ACE5KM_01760 [Planctomycetaceae bacterium]